MWLGVLIMAAAIWATLIWVGVTIARFTNRTSTRPSPTPPTTPTQTSESSALEAMERLATSSLEKMRSMATEMALGRESQSQSGPPETWLTSNVKPPNYDDDSIPLAPGIEATVARESYEDEQHRLLTLRAALQAQLGELAREENEAMNASSPSETS